MVSGSPLHRVMSFRDIRSRDGLPYMIAPWLPLPITKVSSKNSAGRSNFNLRSLACRDVQAHSANANERKDFFISIDE